MLNTRGSEVLSLCDFVVQQCVSTREQESPGPGLPGPHPHPGGRPLLLGNSPSPLVSSQLCPWWLREAPMQTLGRCIGLFPGQPVVKTVSTRQPQAPREPPAPCPPCRPLCHPWGDPLRGASLSHSPPSSASPPPQALGGGPGPSLSSARSLL